MLGWNQEWFSQGSWLSHRALPLSAAISPPGLDQKLKLLLWYAAAACRALLLAGACRTALAADHAAALVLYFWAGRALQRARHLTRVMLLAWRAA